MYKVKFQMKNEMLPETLANRIIAIASVHIYEAVNKISAEVYVLYKNVRLQNKLPLEV